MTSAALTGIVLAVLVAEPPGVAPWLGQPARPVWFIGAAWVVFAFGAWLVRRLPMRAAAAVILAGGVALPLAAGFAPPRSSDDMYRYLWDGRVQAAGVDPYRHAPASPHLVHLRDGYLWPERANWCVTEGSTSDTGDPLTPGCTLINRPAVHTIYPPVAEAYFLAVHLLSASDGRHVPLQLAATAIVAATTILLLVALRRRGSDPRAAVLWAWCPAVAYEAGSNAHVDVLAAFLTGAALVWLASAQTRRAAVFGGMLLGLAVATKLTPALAAPAVIRRRPIAVALGAVGAVAIVYVPHVAAVGADVIGYIPGYLNEEGYADGSRFALLTWLVPDTWAGPLAVVILGAVALLATRGADPDRPWHAAATMTGAALLVAAPSYAWYALLLVVLVALGARPEWLSVAAAGYLAQYAHHVDLSVGTAQRVGYGVALAVVALPYLRRSWSNTRQSAR